MVTGKVKALSLNEDHRPSVPLELEVRQMRRLGSQCIPVVHVISFGHQPIGGSTAQTSFERMAGMR